jgi:hypothetical protein
MGRAMTRGPKPSEGTAPLRSRDGALARVLIACSPRSFEDCRSVSSWAAFSFSDHSRAPLPPGRTDSHRFGARVVYELLAEIGRKTGEMTLVRQIVARYANRLTPEILAATGADRFQLIQFAQSPQRAGHERPACSFAAGTLA